MKTNTRTWKTIAILGHFFELFWHRDCWSKTSRWNRKISHWSLFGGPSNMSYQLSISECCCASVYGKLYIKMLEASNDPILEFSAAGGYTFNFKEREWERERFGPYWRRLHALSTPNDFWTICGKATWTRAVLKQKLSIKSTNESLFGRPSNLNCPFWSPAVRGALRYRKWQGCFWGTYWPNFGV